MQRRDYFLGPFHIIFRKYKGSSQYGVLLWGRTLDIWARRVLLTFRRNSE